MNPQTMAYRLVQIGATPTVDNCRAVLKEMPLENCSVTAAWRSRGCLADAIIIQPGGHRSGAGGGIGAAGGGEAPPVPHVTKTPQNNTSLGKDSGPSAPEVIFTHVLDSRTRNLMYPLGSIANMSAASTLKAYNMVVRDCCCYEAVFVGIASP